MTGSMGELYALLQGLWRCDEGALAALYRRYASLVFGMAWRILGSRAMAEEATQDVFWKLWRRPEAYDPNRGAFSAWLLTVARNAAIDHLRREARQPPISEPPRQVETSPEDLLPRPPGADRTEAEDGKHLRLLLDSLPREQREPLWLAFYGGLSQRDIAEAFSIPLGTVKTRMRLGLHKLRAMYRQGS